MATRDDLAYALGLEHTCRVDLQKEISNLKALVDGGAHLEDVAAAVDTLSNLSLTITTRIP